MPTSSRAVRARPSATEKLDRDDSVDNSHRDDSHLADSSDTIDRKVTRTKVSSTKASPNKASSTKASSNKASSNKASSTKAPSDQDEADPHDEPNADALRRLGQRVKARRLALGFTLRELGKLTSLSTPFLSQVENGVGTPSLTSLFALARVLRTTAEELLAGPEPEAVSVVRAREGVRFAVVDGVEGAVRRQLTGAGEPFSAAEYVIEPGADLGGFEASAGRDLLHVMEGMLVVEVRLDGGSVIERLSAGDTIVYDTDVPHRWSVGTKKRTRVLHIVSTPV